MAKSITVKARGLFLNPNDLGDVPDGALSQATNVVVSRDGIIETRRGKEVVSDLAVRQMGHYGDALVGLAGDTLYYSTDNGSGWTPYDGSYPEPANARMRFVEASGNLYFNASNGIWRLDSLTGTPELAGCFPGMDCQAAISTPVVGVDGTAVKPNSQTAYRILFAKRDANNNVIFGAPTQRAVVTNVSIDVPAGGIAVSAAKVVTVTSNAHGFVTGQMVYRDGSLAEVDEAGVKRFTDGVVGPITTTSPDTFTYYDSNASVSYTSTMSAVYANGYRDVLVSASLPPGIPTGTDYFWQGYKSLSSLGSDVDPGDEEGLTYEGTIPVPRSITTLARTSNAVLATTSVPHGYTPGTVVTVPTGLAGTAAKVLATVSTTAAASSPDGAAWTAKASAGVPTGPMKYAGVAGSEKFMAPGFNVAVVGTKDGATWTNPAAKDGANDTTHYQVAFGGAGGDTWAMVGTANSTLVIFISTDHGATWTKATVGTGPNPIPGGSTYVGAQGGAFIVWDGAKFIAGCLWLIGGLRYIVTVESATGAVATWDFYSRTFVAASVYGPGPAAWDGTKIVSLSILSPAINAVRFTRTGVLWTATPLTPGTFHNSRAGGTHYLNGIWWCVGRSSALTGAVMSSVDGATWSLATGVGDVQGNTDICWDGSQYVMCGGGAAVTTSIYTSPDGAIWTPHVVASARYMGVAAAILDNTIPAGTYTITSVPTTTTFTWASAAPDRASAAAAQTCTPVAVGFLDTVPDSFLGAALYTSPGQETILQQNDRPVVCRDVARYRNYIFWSAPTPLTSTPISLISVGGVTGLRAGDTVTINGAAVTASSVENTFAALGPLTFQVFNTSARTPSQNIADTAASLMRVVNRNSAAFQAILVDTTTIEGVPGQMTIRTTTSGLSTTFAYTSTVSGTPWSPALGITVPTKTMVNELRWAKANQPDAAPELNSIKVAASDKAIVRIVATRSSLFIFKEDGIYQLSGSSPPFQTDPFDLTTDIVGAETAVALDNQVFLFTQNGIQKVSDTGTTLISRPIDPPLQDLLDPVHRPTVKSVAFGIGDNADHKYYLWLPTADGDTQANQAYVYDYFTDAFFHRDDAAYCGINTQDDRLILGTDLGVERERKDFTNDDYWDHAPGGEWYSQIPISTVVQWCPKFGQDPSALNHFQEIAILFRKVYFDVAYLDFYTSVTGVAVATITLDGAAYGLDAAGTEQFALRALVPPECRRAGLLNVRFRHSVGGAPMQIQALSVSFNPGPTRIGR